MSAHDNGKASKSRASWLSSRRTPVPSPKVRAPSWLAPPTMVAASTKGRDDSKPVQVEITRAETTEVFHASPTCSDPSLHTSISGILSEMETLRAALAESMHECARLRRRVLEEAEQELVELALAIAEHVVGRELQSDPSFVFAQAKEGISLLAAKEPVIIAISTTLAEQVPVETWEAQCGMSVEIDPALAGRHVEIRSGHGKVDIGTSARILAVAKSLSEV